jgi:hypothetical protein
VPPRLGDDLVVQLLVVAATEQYDIGIIALDQLVGNAGEAGGGPTLQPANPLAAGVNGDDALVPGVHAVRGQRRIGRRIILFPQLEVQPILDYLQPQPFLDDAIVDLHRMVPPPPALPRRAWHQPPQPGEGYMHPLFWRHLGGVDDKGEPADRGAELDHHIVALAVHPPIEAEEAAHAPFACEVLAGGIGDQPIEVGAGFEDGAIGRVDQRVDGGVGVGKANGV